VLFRSGKEREEDGLYNLSIIHNDKRYSKQIIKQ